jgi:hypothetical protein
MRGAELAAKLGEIAMMTRDTTEATLAVVVVFHSDRDQTAIGAQCPDVETLRALLERVIRSIDDSDAKIIDKTTGRRR